MQPSRRRDPQVPTSFEVARQRQELWMRWILLGTVVLSALASSLATLLYGPPGMPFALVQGTWATLLGWMVRRLFAD